MGRKALKRKLGKKVLAGKLTVGEARARLGREMAQRVQKSARPAWPVQPAQLRPEPRYQGDEEYIRSAFRPIPRPAVAKSRKAAAPARPTQQQLLTKALADIEGLPTSLSGARPLVVKQLSGSERAHVAELRRELERVEHNPARRERIKSEHRPDDGPTLRRRVTFLSKFERANAELRKAPARRASDGITPAHTAASAGLAGDDDEPRRRVRARKRPRHTGTPTRCPRSTRSRSGSRLRTSAGGRSAPAMRRRARETAHDQHRGA